MSMGFVTLGGNLLGTIPLGDIVLYLTPFNLFLFAVLLGFTLLIALSKPETQIEATMHNLGNTEITVGPKEFKQRRFLSIICGIASAGAMITGDLFNFTLFMALVGILNIGIVFNDSVIFIKKNNVDDYYLNIVEKYGSERLEFTDFNSLNDSILFEYYGINNFLSTNNSRVMRIISQMSFKSKYFNQNLYNYQKGQYILDSIIGLKYIVSTYKIDNYILLDEFKIDEKKYYVYENPSSIGIGYIIKDECNNIEFDDFRYDEKVFNCISGSNHSFYKENPINKNNNEYSSIVSKPSDFYLYYPNFFINDIKVDDTILYRSKDYVFIQNDKKNYNFKFIVDNEIDMDKLKVYSFDYEKFKSSIKSMNKEVLNYRIQDNMFIGNIDTDGGLLMITIPYEKGFNVKVDGRKVDYKEVIDTFIGIDLDKGHHEITIDYSQPNLKLGICISLLSFCLIIFYTKKLY